MLAPTGLGGLDLTEGGANVAMRLVMGADQDNGVATLTVYTDAGNYSQATMPIPNTVTGAASAKIYIRLQDFVPVAGGGARFRANISLQQSNHFTLTSSDHSAFKLGNFSRSAMLICKVR